MMFGIDQNRLYLMSGYLLVSLVSLALVMDQAPWVMLTVMGILVIVLVLFYEPLMRSIRDATGSVDQGEASLYAVFLELNKRIHRFLDMEDVLLLLDTTLKSHMRVSRTLFLVSPELLRSDEDPEEGAQGLLLPWRVNGEALDGVDIKALSEFMRKEPGVVTRNDGVMILNDAFDVTRTSLAFAVIHSQRLLAIVMIGRTDERVIWSPQERELFGYLANQLSVILDRIRVYREVMYRTRMDHAEKLQVMQNLSANIAHEMRTPLSGIRASISGIENYLPALVEAYDMARMSAERRPPPIRDQHLSSLRNSPDRIKLMIDQANAVIDMLLVNLRTSSFEQLNRCEAFACVEQAVDRYPFKAGERDKVSVDTEEDFSFMGVELLMIYVLFNLIKNALYSIRSAQKGDIDITLKRGDTFNRIIFTDTGEGIAADVIENIFEGFFTTKSDGTGAGLTFCKRTLVSFGGDISCESVYGEYTRFTMSLPVLKEEGSGETRQPALNEPLH